MALIFPNVVQDITFGYVSWFHEAVVLFGSGFQLSRFESVGPIRYAVSRDGIEDVVVERPAECWVTFACQGNHRLKGFERLDRSLKADGTWLDTMFGGSLCHDCPDQIVGQNMRPEFLPNELR